MAFCSHYSALLTTACREGVKTNLAKLRSIQTTKQTRWKLRARVYNSKLHHQPFSSPFHVLKKLSHSFSSWFLYRKMQCQAVALKSKKTNWRNYVMIIHAQILVTNFNLRLNWNPDLLNEYKTIGIWRQLAAYDSICDTVQTDCLETLQYYIFAFRQSFFKIWIKHKNSTLIKNNSWKVDENTVS